MKEKLLTPADVAERCQLSTKTVLRAIRAGRLRASRLGENAAFRIRPEDVDAWIEASVLEPVRKEPPPLRVVPRPSDVGRLVITPDMGRPSP
jgi:excisionase family DNA binding protein